MAIDPLPPADILYHGCFSPAEPLIGTLITLSNMGADLNGKWVVVGKLPGLDGEEMLRLERWESKICKLPFA